MDDSPISDATLEAAADRVAKLFRPIRKRVPVELRRRVQSILQGVFDAVNRDDTTVGRRIHLARELEALDLELRGRQHDTYQFYADGRLAVVRFYDPIRISETIDHASCLEHVRRYEERIQRAERRLHWFYERAGLEVKAPAAKPWELPYASFDELRELIWGRTRR